MFKGSGCHVGAKLGQKAVLEAILALLATVLGTLFVRKSSSERLGRVLGRLGGVLRALGSLRVLKNKRNWWVFWRKTVAEESIEPNEAGEVLEKPKEII